MKLRLAFLFVGMICASALGGSALPQFAYRTFTVRVLDVEGKPVGGAAIYGFCRELNLIWPRREEDESDRNGIVWQESFLDKTGDDGTAKVTIPSGAWGFFAVGNAGESVVAAWSDFRERSAGETVTIAPAATKHWTLGNTPNELFFKPQNFPVWIPARCSAMNVQLSGGPVRMWASGRSPGFALDLGTLSTSTPDGELRLSLKPAAIQISGGQGGARLVWNRYHNFGLEGEIEVAKGETVSLSPGAWILGYRRSIDNDMTGIFAGQFYSLGESRTISLQFDSSISAALSHDISRDIDSKGNHKLEARLYLVDGNGHLLTEVVDSSEKPMPFDASVTIGGTVYSAPHTRVPRTKAQKSIENQTLVTANIGKLGSDQGAVWKFVSPPNILAEPTITEAPDVAVSSETFRMQVPQILVPRAKSVLTQCDLLAQAIERASGRVRKHTPTNIILHAGSGASAGHNGERMTCGSELLFSDAVFDRHFFLHELAHDFGFNHGGTMESVVELARCGENPLVSQQCVKWMFFDRMNGIDRKEIDYHNSPLYFYLYSQGGSRFLSFMSANEQTVSHKLEKDGFTDDEFAVALCSLAMQKDVSPICARYGLDATSERVAQAAKAAKPLCRSGN